MSTDPLRMCMDAKKELDRALKEVQTIGEFYSRVGGALRGNPPRLMIANTDFGARAEIGLNQSVPNVDFTTWPDKEAVKKKLGAFYDAENAYTQAWRRLPPDERGQFPKPNP
jgi:hypothetical protein